MWGALVWAAAGVAGAGVWWLARWSGNGGTLTATVAGGVAVATVAVLTRGIHLDGLADTADGLGSGRTGDSALEVMRDSSVGAFGAVTVSLCLLIQVPATAAVLEQHGALAVPALAAIGVLARAPLAWLVRRGTDAADDGLGRTVVGAVPPHWAIASAVMWTAAAVALLTGADISSLGAIAAAGVVWLVAGLLRRRALTRFGALTGDVLGAVIETASAGGLVVLAVLG